MPIVLGGGPSITDYPKRDISTMAEVGFTLACNHVGLDYPCDVIVALDPEFIRANSEAIRALGRPVVTRKWANPPEGITLIELPNDIPVTNSGIAACILADGIAATAGDRKSYVLGIDGTKGHYTGHRVADEQANGPMSELSKDYFDGLGLTHTINLSVHSRISAWPKLSKLPKWYKFIAPKPWRIAAIGWIMANGAKYIVDKCRKV